MTRARRVLRVTVPQRYYRPPTGSYDAHGYTKLTRFLDAAIVDNVEVSREHLQQPRASPVQSRVLPQRAGLSALYRVPFDRAANGPTDLYAGRPLTVTFKARKKRRR
jgi:hypothetical protein